MNISGKLAIYVRTLRHLKPIQITNRIKRSLIPAKVNNSPAPAVNLKNIDKFHYIRHARSFLGRDEFYFLNKKEILSFPGGWNNNSKAKLWLYNLHYFDGLLNETTPVELKHHLVEQWVDENPPGQGNGWEPYPNSLRIVNWIKWALAGNELSAAALQSLAVQVRFLAGTLEYHLLGNHLFVNIKALVFAGCFFAGKEAEKWLQKGLAELTREVPEQFLADGAHFELSPTYHMLLTEDLLDIVNILRVSGRSVPEQWIRIIEKALHWAQVMTHPDGLPPLFNDAAYGIAPKLEEILEYSGKLGIKAAPLQNKAFQFLAESGYFHHTEDSYSIIGDVGQIGASYQPAHVHCDMLNFELFSRGCPVIVDTGTSTYDTGPRRNRERSTAAHNTVQIQSCEQSEIWGGFRVGRRAEILKRTIGPDYIEASHNGYIKLGAIHTRKFLFRKNSVCIKDKVTGYDGVSTCRIHLHSGINPELTENKVTAGHVTLQFENASSVKIKDYEYAPEFNKLLPAKVIEIKFSKTLISHIKL